MRQTLVSLLIISILLTACGTPLAPSLSSSPTLDIGQLSTLTPTPTTAPTRTLLASTTTETPFPTAVPSPRWFWAIPAGKDEILAFNAAGQVNTVLDFSGIIHGNNDISPIRMGDDRAIVFFANYDSPKAFLLTSDTSTSIQIPNVFIRYPENSWQVMGVRNPYILLTPGGGVTAPAILINSGTGQASLVADNVFGPTEVTYFTRFSADGQSLRYATGEGPVDVHNLDLQSGKDTVFFQASSHLLTDDFGEIWYDTRQGKGSTADGQSFTVTTSDENTWHFLLKTGGILAIQRTCDLPCPLQAYPPGGESVALNYSLPVSLIDQILYVSYGQLLDQNRLLVSTHYYSVDCYDYCRTLWILTPDGQSQLLGKVFEGNSSTPFYQLRGLSPDGRYLLVYLPDTPSFSVFDLATGMVVFSATTVTSDAFLEVNFFNEGINVLVYDESTSAIHLWVYNYSSGSATAFDLPGLDVRCNAMTTDGRPICVTDGGVVVYDPVSGETTFLIQEPVDLLSN